MKTIVFDIDGVITKSIETKIQIIKKILTNLDIYELAWVKEIVNMHLNRKVMLDKIYDIVPFNKEAALEEINKEFAVLESHPRANEHLVDFIKKNSSKYIFCTSTTMPLSWLNIILDALDLTKHFHEILTTEMGSKKDNIMFVMQKYALAPKDILFVDDNIHNINAVQETWVHTLHFTDYALDIEQYLSDIDQKK